MALQEEGSELTDPSLVPTHRNPSFRGPAARLPAATGGPGREQPLGGGRPSSPGLPSRLVSAPGPSNTPQETARQVCLRAQSQPPPSHRTGPGAPLPLRARWHLQRDPGTDSAQAARPGGGEAGGPAARAAGCQPAPSSAPGPAVTGGSAHPHPSPACRPRLHVVPASSWLLPAPGRLVHAALTWLAAPRTEASGCGRGRRRPGRRAGGPCAATAGS